MRAVIFTGGEHDSPIDRLHLDDTGDVVLVIAADSGLALARRAGIDVDVVVGDMDSVPPALLSKVADAGARIEQHPAAKDKTDLALALDVALAAGAAEVIVIGGDGGRLDHLLGNITLLAADDYRSMRVRARVGSAAITVIRSAGTIEGSPGSLVSLFAVGGPARIRTDGLAYPLTDEILVPGSSRGVSNVLLGEDAVVTASSGVVVVIQPDPAAG